MSAAVLCAYQRAGELSRARSARGQLGAPEHAGDDAIAARAGEAEDVDRRRVDVTRQRVAQQRARAETRVRTVAAGLPRHSAASSTVISSTSRR